MFKRLWTSKSRKRGYDASQQLPTSTTEEVDVSSSHFDLTTPYSQESEGYQPWSETSHPRKRLFQEFDSTDQNALSQSRPNWNTNMEEQVHNDEYSIFDPDDNCTGVGLETSEESFNFDFHNNLDNINTSGWKEFPESTVHVKTRHADSDMKESLGVEVKMVQCSVRRNLNIDENRHPTSKNLFQFFWGERCALTKIMMRATGISYLELLIFLNTICILVVFGMSFNSLGGISQFIDSALMVSKGSRQVVEIIFYSFFGSVSLTLLQKMNGIGFGVSFLVIHKRKIYMKPVNGLNWRNLSIYI